MYFLVVKTCHINYQFHGRAVRERLQRCSHILHDVPLPTFNDNSKQNIVKLLAELDQYCVMGMFTFRNSINVACAL
jgi:hypothetical protein